MNLVRLKLRGDCKFWSLPPITLIPDRKISPVLNRDLLSREQKEIIDDSVAAQEIFMIGADNEEIIKATKQSIQANNSNQKIGTDDIEEDEEMMPEMVSMTVDNPDKEDEEEEVQTELFLEEAKVLLGRNGNTVKKALKTLPKDSESLGLLHASLELEMKEGKRAGVISTIQQIISEH